MLKFSAGCYNEVVILWVVILCWMLQRVKSMQRSGTEAIKIQLQHSKPKWEITNITNSQNTNRTYGRPSNSLLDVTKRLGFSELLFPAGCYKEVVIPCWLL